ncbi:hypothetical protein [Streptomyces odontomachi]|uniref:hypothetical protein n=1 Tax=Streptomyces odontomachi TaxID=2944940 RepID=UPI002108943D|nr:hypothetical protein [Streptomyces sp. ODS25]
MAGTRGTRPPAAPVARRGGRINVAYGSWELIWSHVHRVLVVNLGLTVTSLPLLTALGLCHRPWRYPAFFAVLALGIGPTLAGTFGYLHRADTDDRAPIRAFAGAYRRLFRAALLRWTPCALLVLVAVTDVVTLRASAAGPALVPCFLVVAALATCTGVVALADLARGASGAGRGTWRALLAAAHAAVRRWPLSLLTLALLAVGLAGVNQAPLLGLAVLPGCVLFVVWRNCRGTLAVAPAEPAADSPAGVPRPAHALAAGRAGVGGAGD